MGGKGRTTWEHVIIVMSRDDGFRHDALLYAGEREFVDATTRFVRDGVAADEPVLVVVGAEKIAALQSSLGPDADAVCFADMAGVGGNPARIIPVWRKFVSEHGGEGSPVRGVGEPVYPERSPDEVAGDHHAAVVPAVDERTGNGAQQHVGQRGSQEDEARREGRVGQRKREYGQRDLVQAIAEQTDRLGQPEGGKAGVQGQPDVRMPTARSELDHPAFEVDLETSIDHIEELVFFFVLMPVELSLDDAEPHERYDYLYSAEELKPWLDRIHEIAERARETYVITNNHYEGQGAANAAMLRKLSGAELVEVPPELEEAYRAALAPLEIHASPPDQPRLLL